MQPEARANAHNATIRHRRFKCSRHRSSDRQLPRTALPINADMHLTDSRMVPQLHSTDPPVEIEPEIGSVYHGTFRPLPGFATTCHPSS